jgi:hypothetical protein
MKTVDLSIDFDFFSREDPMWDWGHAEGGTSQLFLIDAWMARYTGADLWTDTDPALHADCLPEELFGQLRARNVRLLPSFTGRFGVAESHEEAFKFFRKGNSPPDALLNIDAHHDAFCGIHGRVDCANWMRYLALEKRWAAKTRIVQLYPKWKDPALDGPPGMELETHAFREWAGFNEPHRIRHVFICRSGAWVPPHLDETFTKFARGWADLFPIDQTEQIGSICRRPCPTREEAAEHKRQHDILMEDVRNRNRQLTENNA